MKSTMLPSLFRHGARAPMTALILLVINALSMSCAAELTRTDLFEAGQDGYKLYRIPGIVVTRNGTVLAYCEARKSDSGDWGPIDIMLRRSTDGGKTWLPRQQIVHLEGNLPINPVAAAQNLDRPGDNTVNNPVAIVDHETGTVHFLYCLEYMRCFYMRSDDDGATWSEPVEITSTFEKFRSEYDWKVIATGPAHGIQLQNGQHTGRLVVPVWLSLGTGGHAHRPSVTSTIYSDDHGQTWQRGEIAVPDTPETVYPNETVVVELADGSVMLNTRSESKAHRRLVTISSDGSTQWSKPRFDETLLEPICMAGMVRVRQPTTARPGLIAFSNPHNLSRRDGKETPGKSRDRINVSIKLSDDDGKTWSANRSLETGFSGYSDLAALPDGTLLCFYERGSTDGNIYRTGLLTVARFDEAWVREGESTVSSIPSTTPLRILPLGDSITRGSYLAHYADGPFKGSPIGLPNEHSGGYRKSLQDRLKAAGMAFEFVGDLSYGAYGRNGEVNPDFDPDHHGLAGFSNRGILNGGTVPTPQDVLDALGQSSLQVPGIVDVLDRHQPNVILLMSGANGFDAPARDQLISTIASHSSAHIYVATIPPQRAPRRGWEQVVPYNASLSETVDRLKQQGTRITLVPIHAALTGDDLLPDGVHPNGHGLEKIAKAWFEALANVEPGPKQSAVQQPNAATTTTAEIGPSPVVDICIYGGTSGGVAAAVQAARMGKRVLLAEPGKHLGGMTSGGLSAVDIGDPRSVGGIAREYFTRLVAKYGEELQWDQPFKGHGGPATGGAYSIEPHIAEQVFNEMVAEPGVIVWRDAQLKTVEKSGARITGLTMADGRTVQARMFIDTTYEGDLLAAAGVSYTLEREGNARYGESFNGIHYTEKYRPRTDHKSPGPNGRVPGGQGVWDRDLPLDPYITPGDPTSGLLPLINSGEPGTPGEPAPGVQAYCFRLCLSTADDRLPIDPPANYDPKQYELVARFIAGCVELGDDMDLRWFSKHDPLPNNKWDFNTATFGGNLPGASWEWPEATYARRAEIARDIENYHRGLLHFLATDERVPPKVRQDMSRFGLPRDEFLDHGGWPHQLYVREGRRMVSDFVMTEHHTFGREIAPHSIGLGSYGTDVHEIRRIVKDGVVTREGKVASGRGGFGPYQIGYGAIVPRKQECENLFVTFALSASHTAFASIRMEPVFMITSQSAATAAALAMDANVPVQDVDQKALRTRLLADGQILDGATPSAKPASTAHVVVQAQNLAGIVLDNSDAHYEGTWLTSNRQPSLLGQDYRHDNNQNQGTCRVTFTPEIPADGEYEVRLLYNWHPNRATNTPVTIEHANGTSSVTVNQREPGLVKQVPAALGVFSFKAGKTGKIVVANEHTDGYVVVDGLQLVPISIAHEEREGKRKSGFPDVQMYAVPPPAASTRQSAAAMVAFSPLAAKTIPTPKDQQHVTRRSDEPVLLAKASRADELDGRTFDVVVVGGTGGGVACAVRAAREGCSVLLVQHNGHLGGMMTNGLMQWDALYGGPRSPLFSELLTNIENYYISTFGRDSSDHQTIRCTHEHYPISWAEPHVAEREYNRLVAGEKNITLLLHHIPTTVTLDGALIQDVTLREYSGPKSITVRGSTFVDATYEGDLFALAKVPYRAGREARDEYQEPHAGKVFTNIASGPPQSVASEGLNIRQYGSHQGTIDPDSPFTADRAVQAYNYRFCVSSNPDNRLPIPKPASYNRDEYVNYGRKYIASHNGPNGKGHVNSPILPGENHDYPDADWPTREKIIQRHLEFGLGLMWFLQHDESIPESKRKDYLVWGLPKDEYADNGHVPYEMYVRETRRIVGRHIFTEHDGMLTKDYSRTPIHPDSIAVTDWYMDSHSCTTDHRPGYHYDGKLILTEESRPSQIPYRSLLPQGVDNLLVPVCLSATHIAWGAIRLEPVFLQTGEAAGFAAALAKQQQTTPASLDSNLLVRTLVERGQLVSFFNDLKVSASDPQIQAAQFFGTHGFFGDYNARLDEPLSTHVAAEWDLGFRQLQAGKLQPRELVKRVHTAEKISSSPTPQTRGAALQSMWTKLLPP